MKKLILFSTSACHLCEQAYAVIESYSEHPIELRVVDIADDDALIEQYGVRIPVVMLEDSEHDLGWPFDLAQLARYLN
ncbi:MAG: glutaredoxin family protein [Pseudomonadales bacterium]